MIAEPAGADRPKSSTPNAGPASLPDPTPRSAAGNSTATAAAAPPATASAAPAPAATATAAPAPAATSRSAAGSSTATAAPAVTPYDPSISPGVSTAVGTSPLLQGNAPKKSKGEADKRRKQVVIKREKLKENSLVQSDNFTWKVIKLLGSGGFGDVYQVVKEKNNDKKIYAMKTEMVEGDKRNLRLKIEVHVLTLCLDLDKKRKQHFVELIDRGKRGKYKFLVMTLVGSTIEDVRRNVLGRNYSKSTAMQLAQQTLESISDLHSIGYLHRDIKPQNFAIGLGEQEKIVFVLDFGIARKYTVGKTKTVKAPRLYVKFIGTVRYASRCCHKCMEQGRKDDLEAWIYMVFDLIDWEDGLQWKRLPDRKQVVHLKDKFFAFRHEFGISVPKCYRIVPEEFKRVVTYVNKLSFSDEPDYRHLIHLLHSIARANNIDLEKQLDWIGRSGKCRVSEEDVISSDNLKTGSSESESEDSPPKEKSPATKGKLAKAIRATKAFR
nr:Serine threonine protein kinase-related domain containing protein [Haemonchus contortus]